LLEIQDSRYQSPRGLRGQPTGEDGGHGPGELQISTCHLNLLPQYLVGNGSFWTVGKRYVVELCLVAGGVAADA